MSTRGESDSGSTTTPTTSSARLDQTTAPNALPSSSVDNYFEHEEEPVEKFQKDCPELTANIFSKLLFWWFNPLMATGYKKVLEMSDLYRLRPNETAGLLADNFANSWKGQSKPSLIKTLHLVYGRRFYMAGIIKFVYDITQLVSPYFTKLIIDYVSKPDEPAWIGYSYAIGLLLLNIVGTVLVNQYFHIVMTHGMRIRTGLRTAIYRKTLKLSGQAKQKMNTGDIINYMSVDTQKIGDLISYLHMIWSGLFQMTVCMAFLFYFIGFSAFVGLAIMIIIIPIQGFVARFVHRARKEMMKHAGERIKTINEILQGIRVIKFYAWENSFVQKALKSRALEILKIKRTMYINTISAIVMHLAPLLVSVGTFAVYALIGKKLDAAVIFPALSYFNLLRFPLTFFPTIVALLAETKLSLKRLETFLLAEEVTPPLQGTDSDVPIKIIDGEFTWKSDEAPAETAAKDVKKTTTSYGQLKDEEDTPVEDEIDLEEKPATPVTKSSLRDINIQIQKGSLTAVVGLVGSGKSSFLSAIIGEMKQIKGVTEISSSIAYCPQQAWIQNCSVRENITFGNDFEREYYEDTVRVCALQRDFEILPGGDSTEIGEKGINLSGGQRQRVSLARAVYSNAETYLFDDVLSAVDAHVGRYIFDECITGLLKNKTRVLVTHQWQYLSKCDHIIVFQDGVITESGSYEELMSNGEFSETLRNFTSQEDEHHKEEQETSTSPAADESATNAKKPDEKKAKLMENEERSSGSVKFQVYKDYARYSGGYIYVVLILLIYLVSQVLLMGNSYWLAVWSDETTGVNAQKPKHNLAYYLGIYFAFGAAASVLQFIREILFGIVGLWASSNLHAKALQNIVRAPTRFFDTTPVGRIINRFSKDTESVDTALIFSLKAFISCAVQVLGTFGLIIYVTPFFVVPMLPVLIVYYFVQQYYRSTSRELKRLESISRSPLFAHFGETLTGISTIRAYSKQDLFQDDNQEKLDANNKAGFCQLCSQRWLSVRLEMIGNTILFASALFCVVGRNLSGFAHVDPGLAGLSLSYALQVTGVLNWAVRSFTETEAAMNSVERLLHYCEEIEQEAAYEIESTKPQEEWPQSGNISFNNVFLKYRSDLDFVLKGFSAQVYGAEKIGIVGRTGAGKSSLMAALFRLVELSEGSIVIDDVDISNIGLHDLRSKLSIIPQDPVLFSGTVRFNLDPFDEYSDKEIWQALERAHMKKTVEELDEQLSSEVTENGENFSVGQRQLFCLARAILRKTKVLVLDEATASVDLSTDSLIQQTVRTEFVDRTVLTIAHRLNTIIDSDRIMVLELGELAEFDTPKNLLSNQSGLFTHLCRQTGKQNFTYLKQIANGEISYSDELAQQLNKVSSPTLH